MTIMHNAALAAIALACLSSAATAEPIEVRVVRADLDLSQPAGRAALDRRLATAVRQVCSNDMDDLAGKARMAECRAEMMRNGRGQIAALSRNGTVQVAALAR